MCTISVVLKACFEILNNNAFIFIETKIINFRFDFMSLLKANAKTVFFFSVILLILIFFYVNNDMSLSLYFNSKN